MSTAVICAVRTVALVNEVVRLVPFHCTVDPETNPVPLTVNVKVAPPTVAVEGESVVIVGSGGLIVKVAALEVPPPGAGFTTVTCPLPALAMSAAVICVVRTEALVNEVVRLLPFHWTVDAAINPVPLTVS